MFYWTASDDSLSEEPGSFKISIKEIYAATDNLSAVNFIGQGGAGKNVYDAFVLLLLLVIMTD